MAHLRTVLLLALAAGCTPEAPSAPADDGLARTPQRRALRRLNRSEYDRTVRDLLGTTAQPARDFPSDDSSHGFDNAADALALSPLLVESYEGAAAKLAKEIVDRPLEAPIDEDWPAVDDGAWAASTPECNNFQPYGFALWCDGELSRSFSVPETGTWRITASVSATQAFDDLARVSLSIDGLDTLTFEVTATRDAPQEIVLETILAPGPHVVELAFDNDAYDVETEADRSVFVHHVALHGPTPFEPRDNGPFSRVMTCVPEGPDGRACAEEILRRFTPRAWRRPVTDAEIEALLSHYDRVVAMDDPPLWGMEFALRAVLTSPNFVFLTETPPAGPDDALDAFELASRLSYFLWSSMPDDELWAAAEDGSLLQTSVLEAQVARMLADDKAEALVDDFAGQWLFIRAVDDASPDAWYFPEFTPVLRESMKGQMSAFFGTFVGSDRSLRELLTSEYGHIDDKLAAFYGVDSEPRNSFRRYDLGNAVDRYGWLSQAGLQMALSYPTRTSPVRRGVWVLTNLLCEEPDPPPPGVEGLPETDAEEPTTLREVFEQHREKPVCATCHDDIDPIGFAFEHYDGIGKFRTDDAGVPVDASGELPDGTTFEGLTELAFLLADDERFSRCMVDKTFTYALGRPPSDTEEGIVEDIHSRFAAGDLTFEALATALATSPSFRRRGTPGGAP